MNKQNKHIINDEPIIISFNNKLSGLIISKGGYILKERPILGEDLSFSDLPSAFVMIVSNNEEIKELDKNIDTILNAKNDEAEKLARDFEIHYGFSFKDIFAFGKTSFDYKSIGSLIPKAILKHKSIDSTELYMSCKCYAKNEWKKLTSGNVIPHEDSRTSWNCFMAIAGNPEYGIIIKEYNKK